MAPRLWRVKPPLGAPKSGVFVGPGASEDRDSIWFGTLGEVMPGSKQHRVYLSTAKEQVIALVGKRGSGKSFTLGVIAEGLGAAESESLLGRQRTRRAVLLFDPLDIYWTARFPVTVAENPEANRHFEMAKSAGLAGLSFDVMAWIPGGGAQRTADPDWFEVFQISVGAMGLDEWELLLDVNVLSDPMGQALVDALGAVRTGYDKAGNAVAPKEDFSIGDVIDALDSPGLQGYHRETLRAVRQRLRSLDATGLFVAHGTNIIDMLVPGRVTVLLLERLSQSYRSAVVALLTRMLIDNRSQTAFAEKRLALDPTLSPDDRAALEAVVEQGTPRTVVALDEAQAFLAPGVSGPARSLFVRLVKEGRNFGLSAILATQQPSAIDQRILSQVETFVSHQLVTETDIRAVGDNLKSPLAEEYTLGTETLERTGVFRRLPPGQCLVSAADTSVTPQRSILVTVRPRATVHGGIEL